MFDKTNFDVYQKIDVNGKNTHDTYKFLRSKSELYDNVMNTAREIPWNFSKFLVDKYGQVRKFYGPLVEP